MKTTTLAPVTNNSSSGFTLYGQVVDIVKHDGKDALKVKQLSGKEPGREIIVTMRQEKGSKAVGFDETGLTALKIKKGTKLGLTDCFYTNKETGEINTRRATKVGSDFRPEQTLAVASNRADIKQLSAFVLTPKDGFHGIIDEAKKDSITGLLTAGFDKIGDDKGLMLVISDAVSSEKDGKKQVSGHTLYANFSRYHRESADAQPVLLSKEEFARKVEVFLSRNDSKLRSFDGLTVATMEAVLTDDGALKAAVIPSNSIYLTGAKFLNDGAHAVTAGISSVGVGISPPTEERSYPIIQQGSLEVAGLYNFRAKAKDGEGNVVVVDDKIQYTGPTVRSQPEDFLMNRLVGQIDMLNGIALQSSQSTAPAPTETPAENAATSNEAKADSSDHAVEHAGIDDQDHPFDGFDAFDAFRDDEDDESEPAF